MNRFDTQWRVLDTGLHSAAENIAMSRAILEAHQQGLVPHTLRFLQFTPSALLGYHQSVEQELDADYCLTHGIEIQRRITGGGAVYFDSTQIGWELYLDKTFFGTAKMAKITRRICEAAAQGLHDLGVDAWFRPRNDIEVNGRKISETGTAFGVECYSVPTLNSSERAIYQRALCEIEHPNWVFQYNRSLNETETLSGLWRCDGGLMRVEMVVDKVKGRLKQCLITGDFFINPKRFILDLEAALRDTLISDLNNNIHNFFVDQNADTLLIGAEDFIQLFEHALQSQPEEVLLA